MKPRNNGKTTSLKRFTVDLTPEDWERFRTIKAYFERMEGFKYTKIDTIRKMLQIIYREVSGK